VNIGIHLGIGIAASVSTYNLLTDPAILSMYEPDNGLGSLAGIDGTLASVGTAVPVGGSFDGHKAYQIAAKSGTTGYLKSAGSTLLKMPLHVFVIGRFGAAATINTVMCSSWAGGVGYMGWWDSTHITVSGGSNPVVATTPNSFHLYEIYFHSNFTFVSVDGGAFVKINIGTGGDWGGTQFGIGFGAVNPTDCDILAFLKVEGLASESLRTAAYARYKAMFPTTLTLPASPPAIFSTLTTTPSALFDPTIADGVVGLGQSNICAFATDNSSAAWAAGTFQLGKDNVWKAGGDPAVAFNWDSPSAQTDTVSLNSNGARGNLMGALVNAMKVASGRNTVAIGCALSASAIVVGAASAPNLDWNRNVPRGNNQRNSLYWSSVFRAKEFIRWGGTIKKIVWYQGETEAQNASSVIRAAWPAAVHAFIRQWCADVGIPNPYDNVGGICKTVIVRIAPNAASNWTDFRTNVVPTIPQNANQVLVDAPNGPFEVDNIHLRSAPLDTLGALIAAA
jgi:hypothetical protein